MLMQSSQRRRTKEFIHDFGDKNGVSWTQLYVSLIYFLVHFQFSSQLDFFRTLCVTFKAGKIKTVIFITITSFIK